MRLFVNHLTNVDFSFLHPQRGLVGETWLASIELQGDLDDQGMVLDFGQVKRVVRQYLDEQIDHRLLIPSQSPELSLTLNAQQTECRWGFAQAKQLEMIAPLEAVTVIDAPVITAETVAGHCVRELTAQFPKVFASIHLRFAPESINGPYYHYSHGLKKHSGNCQRIAHGHRSKIHIWRNGELSLTHMEDWAGRLRDGYIGTREDLVETKACDHYRFQYQAQQGNFSLTLPSECCTLMETDTTVERIAEYIAHQLHQEEPQAHFLVQAYEGFEKGAVVSSGPQSSSG